MTILKISVCIQLLNDVCMFVITYLKNTNKKKTLPQQSPIEKHQMFIVLTF